MKKFVIALSFVVAPVIFAQTEVVPTAQPLDDSEIVPVEQPALARPVITEAPALKVFTNSGNANYLTKFDTDGTTVINSNVFFSSGLLGVNTTSPAKVFHLDVGSATNDGLRISRNGATNSPYLDIQVNTTAATPTASLQVADSSAFRTLALSPSGGGVAVGGSFSYQPIAAYGAVTLNGPVPEILGLYDLNTMNAGVGGALAFGGPYTTSGTVARQYASIQGFKENATSGDYAGAFRVFTRVNGGNPVERLRVSSGGLVGIGTTTPGSILHVNGTGTQNVIVQGGTKVLYITPNSAGGNAYSQIANRAADTMGLSLSSKDTNPEYLYVTASGNVGVGTTTPASKFHVNGNLQITGDLIASGNVAAKYQDVAEWVPSRHDLDPGTVVVLDTTIGNSVVPSHSAYDTTVAGVVSAQPGLILGEGGANKEQIATTGRVRVKVDATVAAIKIGDLLVTSDRTGYAMKSIPLDVAGFSMHRPGTIVGKALEPLESGEGEILVLLSLQ